MVNINVSQRSTVVIRAPPELELELVPEPSKILPAPRFRSPSLGDTFMRAAAVSRFEDTAVYLVELSTLGATAVCAAAVPES